VNLLSLQKGKRPHPVKHVTQGSFVVHLLPDRGAKFHCRGKLYVADWNDQKGAYTIAVEGKLLHANAEAK
jgi:hypothetical protein